MFKDIPSPRSLQRDAQAIYFWTGCLSSLASIVVITYILLPPWIQCLQCKVYQPVSWSGKLYLNIAISHLIYSSSSIVIADGTWCEIQGAFNQLGGIATLLWIGMTGKILSDIIINNKDPLQLNMKRITVYSWAILIILFTLPATNFGATDKSYGNKGQRCWINCKRPLWFIIFYLISVYFASLKRDTIQSPRTWREKWIVSKNIGILPLILVIMFVPATIRRVWDFLNWANVVERGPSHTIILLQAWFSGLIGLVDCSFMMLVFITKEWCNCNWKSDRDLSGSTGRSSGEEMFELITNNEEGQNKLLGRSNEGNKPVERSSEEETEIKESKTNTDRSRVYGFCQLESNGHGIE